MAIKTSKNAQNNIIKYYSAALEKQGIKPIKSSRGGPHLRINYAGDAEKLLSKILTCSIKSSDVSISGSYPTQELTVKKALPGVAVGDQIYLVIAVSTRGALKPKQLTPDKLGFAGSTIKKEDFITKVKKAIDGLTVPTNIKTFLYDLMDASSSNKTDIKNKNINEITDADLNIIAKDFGELSGALWFMNVFNKNVTSITYPTESNAALVDYYANTAKSKIAVSAKANEGAPPSIDAIAAILKKMSFTDKKKEAARLAIIAISENSVVDGIVEAAKKLGHPGYKWLKTNFFNNKDFTAAECEPALAGYKKSAAILSDLKEYYELIGRSASKEIADRLIATKSKRWGLIISPLGYSLVDMLNNNQTYLDVLNEAAKTIKVSQIYMKILKSQKKVDYTVKEFSASNFKFEYNANAGQPGLKKISFKMSK
jgi:hypothetical protein